MTLPINYATAAVLTESFASETMSVHDDAIMITSDAQRERTLVQIAGFRRALERLHHDQADKGSSTLRVSYEKIVRQLEKANSESTTG